MITEDNRTKGKKNIEFLRHGKIKELKRQRERERELQGGYKRRMKKREREKAQNMIPKH